MNLDPRRKEPEDLEIPPVDGDVIELDKDFEKQTAEMYADLEDDEES